MSIDRPRFLARKLGYVESSAIAMDKLEAVDAKAQARLSLAARRVRDQQLREAWAQAHGQIDGALRTFKETGRPDRQTLSDARTIERSAARIGKRLGL